MLSSSIKLLIICLNFLKLTTFPIEQLTSHNNGILLPDRQLPSFLQTVISLKLIRTLILHMNIILTEDKYHPIVKYDLNCLI